MVLNMRPEHLPETQCTVLLIRCFGTYSGYEDGNMLMNGKKAHYFFAEIFLVWVLSAFDLLMDPYQVVLRNNYRRLKHQYSKYEEVEEGFAQLLRLADGREGVTRLHLHGRNSRRDRIQYFLLRSTRREVRGEDDGLLAVVSVDAGRARAFAECDDVVERDGAELR